jgi:hypothetical protein
MMLPRLAQLQREWVTPADPESLPEDVTDAVISALRHHSAVQKDKNRADVVSLHS